MSAFWTNIFRSGPFIPHGHCYLWQPNLVWLHLLSDALIALAYFSIPITLFYFVRQRRDLPFDWIFVMFGAFIIACGTTHVMEIWTLWHPTYWVAGVIKAMTAFVSVFTALQLVPLVPQALALPSPAQLAEANQQLQREIIERSRIEKELKQYRDNLEELVAQRTQELSTTNAQLHQEIVERKRTEVALQESVLNFRTLADTMPQMFWTTRSDGYHEYFNQRWYGYTGLTWEQTIGWGWNYILHPDDQQRTLEIWQECLRTGKEYSIEYRFRRYDGEYRWFLGRAFALRNEQGQIVRWFGSCTDIHDQKCTLIERDEALERERAARNALEAANRVKDEFLAVLSHELRTPLNPILGWVKLLLGKEMDAKTQRKALQIIERNTELQTRLIDDLLDVSRILQGKLKLNITTVNLVATVEAALETVVLAAEAKNIQLEYVNDSPVQIEVMGDESRLQQVVWNLLSNAVKFTPNRGRVEVRAHSVGNYAEITVTDTGKGIKPEFLPYVFDAFRQADSSITRTFGGLGLGLAIVKHLVELHGGTVKVESPGEGLGATFTVSLPLLQSRSAPVLEARQTELPTQQLTLLNGVEVLLVEDEVDAREVQKFTLEQAGARVIAVASASAALKVLRSSLPDVLVSDIGMAHIDGYEFMRQVRKLPVDAGGKIPAIALTAYATDTDQQQAIGAGFQIHLSKPVEPEKLVQAVLSLVEPIDTNQ